jgi:WD40 repeat protein
VDLRAGTGLASLTAFRSDGRRLATTGPNGDLKVWDTTDPRQPALLVRLHRRHRVLEAAWNPTAADLLATLATDGAISVWRMVDDRPPHEMLRLLLPYGRSGAITWLPDGRHIACASTDGVISAWDLVSGTRQTQVLGDSAVCLTLACCPGGGLRAVYRDGSIRQPGMRTRHIQPVTAAAWSLTGGLLAAGRDDGSVEVRNEKLRAVWSGEQATTGAMLLAWHEDDAVVVADQAGRSLAVVDASGRTVWRTRLATPPTSVSVADEVVAVGGHHFAPRIVQLADGKELTS